MSLAYHRADELPAWVATITINGVAVDFSTDWTFTVSMSLSSGPAVLTKTGNITGNTDGSVAVVWDVGELDIPENRYRIQLTGKRTSDDRQFTIQDTVEIKSRTLAEA